MTTAQKLEAIAAAGLQGAAIVRFTLELSRWDPEAFVRAALVDWLRVAEVSVGANFLFGNDSSGTFCLLQVLRVHRWARHTWGPAGPDHRLSHGEPVHRERAVAATRCLRDHHHD
jgi:hypothetical protein